MDELLLLAIEADRKPPPHCDMRERIAQTDTAGFSYFQYPKNDTIKKILVRDDEDIETLIKIFIEKIL